MQTTSRDTRTTGLVVALVLGLASALTFAVGDVAGALSPDPDALISFTWILGLALLVWATIAFVVVMALIVRDFASRRRPALIEALLVIATLAVIAATLAAHPLFGSGGGTA
ncbi:hypothetical protein [Microbacterium sp. P02]|uniref:hypothetical protein n=1 Tax=unclassified Microbacterium TaxID=2609290 RepID=UPI00366B9EA6